MRSRLLLALPAALAACVGAPTPAGSATTPPVTSAEACAHATLDAAGGEIALEGVTVAIGAGLLAGPTDLELCLSDAAPEGFVAASRVATLTPPLELGVAATVTVPYTGAGVALFAPDAGGDLVRQLRATLDGAAATAPLYRSGTFLVAEDARVQAAWTGTPAEDVLFVVDDSCSMGDDQVALADNMSRVLGDLAAAGDRFRVGVVSTDPNDGGRLQDLGGGRLWLDADQPDFAQAFADGVTLGTLGIGVEEGLGAAWNALETLAQTDNAGFRRSWAQLAVVVVSDERDQTPRAVVTPTEFTDWLAAEPAAPGWASFHAAVTLSGPDTGVEYLEIADAFGGEVFDLAQDRWPGFLDDVVAHFLPYGVQPVDTDDPASVGVWILPADGGEPVPVEAWYEPEPAAIVLGGDGIPPGTEAVAVWHPAP